MSIVHLKTGTGSGGNSTASADSDAELIEALRHRAALALERAYRFLETHGDDWVLLRAQVLCEARPAADLAAKLAEVQGADGRLPMGSLVAGGGLGFPQTDLAGLDAASAGLVGTLEALLLAGDAKVLHADWVESAARFLEGLQSSAGVYHVPCLVPPGTSAEVESVMRTQADVFWTGMVAGILGRTPVSRPASLEAAGGFLGERFDPEVVEHDGYPALLAYSHFFTNVSHELADEALQWCGRALEKGFRSRQLDAVSTIRVLLTCDAQAMPGATFDVTELLERLLEEQAGDGGFAELSLGGPAQRTTQTFDAMLGIVRLCAALDA